MTRLQRMKIIATGLLAAAGVVYVLATALEPRYPWLYYVARASEAAMIGAIADWFAVVALFHYPLNLRFIPHTAILPRNKARIANGLSEFIQHNFLSAAAVVERIAAFGPARSLCRWLLKRENADTLAGYLTRVLAYGLAAVDDARVRAFLQRAVSARLRHTDLATLAAQLLDVLTEERRHHALLEEALTALDDLLAREETRRFIAEEVKKGSPAMLRTINQMFDLKLDERAALRIVDVALRKISEVRRDRDHELRRRFDQFAAKFIAGLKDDEALRARVHRLRDELLDNPALGGYVGGLWEEFRVWLGVDLQLADSAVRRRAAALIGELGERLEADPAIRQWIDEQVLAAAPALVEEHRAKFGRFVEDQINAWQEDRLVAELERHIGTDLQYIRINGTVVGALVGLALAALTQLARGGL
jgi:uncharacterized membrane-anchored protein YjiN (DUF445 family)